MKLNECRNDIEHLKNDAKETKKSNRKLQLRVQTYEKKLELQQIKEQQMTAMLEKANEDVDRIKLEQETYSILVSRNSFEVYFFPINLICDIRRREIKKKKQVKLENECKKANRNYLNLKIVSKAIRIKAKNVLRMFTNSKFIEYSRTSSMNNLNRLKKQYDNLKIRCSEHEQRNQKLISLLNEQQVIIDGLNSEKR